MSEPTLTLFRLVPRPAGLASEEALSRWSRHAEFVMAMPSWRHVQSYSHCRVIEREVAGREFVGTRVDYMMPDAYVGIELFQFAGPTALSRFTSSDDRVKEAHHFEESFGVPQIGDYAICRENPVIDRDGSPILKGFTFLRRRSHLTRSEFLLAWEPFSKANIQANPGMSSQLISYIQHHGLTTEAFAESGFDGVIELAYPSHSTPIEMHTAGDKAQVRERQTFYDVGQLVSMLVTETVISDTSGLRTRRATAARQ